MEAVNSLTGVYNTPPVKYFTWGGESEEWMESILQRSVEESEFPWALIEVNKVFGTYNQDQNFIRIWLKVGNPDLSIANWEELQLKLDYLFPREYEIIIVDYKEGSFILALRNPNDICYWKKIR